MLFQHIEVIVNYTKGRCYTWDVINEPLLRNGSMKDSIWYRALGEDYIAEVLTYVRLLDPSAKLFINDDEIAEENAKSDGTI
jgi:endo-1,4-beta-xylanase